MSTHSYHDYVAVPISIELYQELLRRHGASANAVIEGQVEDFLTRTQDDIPRSPMTGGISWETFFLPDRTRLRTKYYKEYKYADVVGDEIIYENERFTSVAQVANRMRGDTKNNAWNVMEVLRPTDSKWISAKFLRRRG